MSLRDQQLTVAFYADEVSPRADVIQMTWAELVETLTEDRPAPCTVATCAGKKCPHKSSTGEEQLGAWSPVTLREPRRNNDLVEAVHVLVLDGDGLTQEQLLAVSQKLQGGSWVAHTTHRHREGCAFIRVALQLSRPVLAPEWREFRSRAIELLGLGEIFDPTCKDLSRLYFLPTHPSDAPFFAEVGDGEPLNVDLVLSRSSTPTPTPTPTPTSTSTNENLDEDPADASTVAFTSLADLVKMLKQYRRSRSHNSSPNQREQAALIGRLLEGRALAAPGPNADPPPIEPPKDLIKGRGYAIMRAATICTAYLPTDVPDEVYLHIFARSLDEMCFGRPSDRDEMEEQLLEKLELGRARRKKFDEERAQRAQASRSYMNAVMEERERIKQRNQRTMTVEEVAGELQSPVGDEPPAASDAWLDNLRTNNSGTHITSSHTNADLILHNATELQGCFRWNDVTLKIDTFGIFAHCESASLDVYVASYLSKEWGYDANFDAVYRHVKAVAYENRYDPLKDYLRSIKWEGRSLISADGGWLAKYAGAVVEGPEPWRKAMIEEIGRKFLVGAVARALDPGCKCDNVLILEGKQGARKSSLFEALGGEFYADASLMLGDKDSKMVAGRSWICELPDLAALKRSNENNAIKAFFTVREDTFRPPFERATIKSPRRNVYAGTTNDKAFLVDPTGNRRYMCVKCDQVDLAAVLRDRDQLWAEAVYLYDKHVNECVDKLECGCWWFSGESAKNIERLASGKMGEDATTILIYEWWIGLTPAQRTDVTTVQVAKEALECPVDKISNALLGKVMTALESLGFTESRARKADGSRPRVYVPSDELLALPQSEEGKKKQIKFFKPNLKVVE